MPIQFEEYRLIEYGGGTGIGSVNVSKDLGTRALPCNCEFGFVVEFTGTPTERETIRIEVADSEDRTLFCNEFFIRELMTSAGRARFRLDKVTFLEPGIYTVRGWLGTSQVFSRALTLARECPPSVVPGASLS